MKKISKNYWIALGIFVVGVVITDRASFGFGDTHVKRALAFLLISTLISLFFVDEARVVKWMRPASLCQPWLLEKCVAESILLKKF